MTNIANRLNIQINKSRNVYKTLQNGSILFVKIFYILDKSPSFIKIRAT